ncbi:MAG TPA: hypothetical protein VGU43_03715 [Thermoplasmata archaeon]|nr:hypothetical protein [Thermoplasmata archaeon]
MYPLANGPPAPRRHLGRTAAVALIAVGLVALIAVGLSARSPGGSSPFYANLRSINWVDPNATVIATSPGMNVSQGQLFTLSVLLGCTAGAAGCRGSETVRSVSAMGLGAWPAGVSPCGYFRVAFNVTASNLPIVIPPGGSATLTVTLQVPNISYPYAYDPAEAFDYSGTLYVTLGPSP